MRPARHTQPLTHACKFPFHSSFITTTTSVNAKTCMKKVLISMQMPCDKQLSPNALSKYILVLKSIIFVQWNQSLRFYFSCLSVLLPRLMARLKLPLANIVWPGTVLAESALGAVKAGVCKANLWREDASELYRQIQFLLHITRLTHLQGDAFHLA